MRHHASFMNEKFIAHHPSGVVEGAAIFALSSLFVKVLTPLSVLHEAALPFAPFATQSPILADIVALYSIVS